MGNPLVDAHAEVCFLVAGRMSSCSNCSWCCCSWSLLKLLLFPEQSLTPLCLSFLSHSTAKATIQGAGSACIQSYHLFSVAAGLSPFFFFHADFGLSPPSVHHGLSLRKATGKKGSMLFLVHRERLLAFNASCHSEATSFILLSIWYAFISSLHILPLKEGEKTEVTR